MVIYAESLTPRLQYIVSELLPEVQLTDSVAAFHDAPGPRINYSAKKFEAGELLVRPCGLLTETGIRKQKLQLTEWAGYKAFFPTQGDIPFDIFAASFYLISRYEEYLPHAKDSYGRFAHAESLAHREGFLQAPLVNQWLQQLRSKIEGRPHETADEKCFRFIPTYDIDIAFAGKGKGRLRRLAAALSGRKTELNGRDIFDVYDWLDELHRAHSLDPVYFFLAAKKRAGYDKNISIRSAAFRRLVKRVASLYSIGIHPSWQSHDDPALVGEELKKLSAIAGGAVSKSRQHYIKFTLPHTFRSLPAAGITEDYSMGYGSINGFRASYASAFHWYDLMREERTSLILHPFCFMDANASFEQKLDAAAALAELKEYYSVVKSVGGNLVTIFHNHFLTEEENWLPWRDMYSSFLEWQGRHATPAVTSLSPLEQS